MKRRLPILILALGGAGFILIIAVVAAFLPHSAGAPTPDYRLLRAHSLIQAGEHLAALTVLGDIPMEDLQGGEAYAYLGAAYMHLHLYQAAIDAFQESALQSPEALDPRVGLASTYMRLGNGPRALEQARKAAELARDSIDAWLVLGRIHWFQGNMTEAENAAVQMRTLDPQYPEAAELLLHIHLERNEPEKFEAVLDQVSDPTPGIRDVTTRFFIRQGRFRTAYDHRNRSARRSLERRALEIELTLAREPARTELYPELVRTLVDLERAGQAIAAARLYDGPVRLDFELGKAHWMAGNRDEAIRAFRRASSGRVHQLSAEAALAAITRDLRHWNNAFRAERIEQDYFVLAQLEDLLGDASPAASPMEKAFILRYAGIYDPHYYNRAVEQALSVLNTDPVEFDALMTIGVSYQRIGRNAEARRYFERAREVYPGRAEPWARLGTLALGANDLETAIAHVERAVRLDPYNPGYLYNLGVVLDRVGRTAHAAGYYERAIAASPLSFEAMNNLALIHSDQGRQDLALALLRRAIEADPGQEFAYFNLADHYARQHAWRDALANYRRVLDVNPANVDAAIEAGRVHMELGQMEQAMKMLTAAVELDAHAAEAYTVLSSVYERTGHNREALAALAEARRILPGDSGVAAAIERLRAANAGDSIE